MYNGVSTYDGNEGAHKIQIIQCTTLPVSLWIRVLRLQENCLTPTWSHAAHVPWNWVLYSYTLLFPLEQLPKIIPSFYPATFSSCGSSTIGNYTNKFRGFCFCWSNSPVRSVTETRFHTNETFLFHQRVPEIRTRMFRK